MTHHPLNVAIIGAAAAPVGKLAKDDQGNSLSESQVLAHVVADALEAAGIAPNEIDGAIFTQPTPSCRQLGFATHMAAKLGLKLTGNLTEVAQMGLTGGLAFDQAIADIALGRSQIALALGVAFSSTADRELMSDYSARSVGDVDFHAPLGLTPISWYALDAMRYMHETGCTREQLAAVAVKSRRAAQSNPLAQMRHPITEADVLDAPMIVEPLGLLDVPPIGDGAICLVLAEESIARASSDSYVCVRGRGFGHDGNHQMSDDPSSDMTRFQAARSAADQALHQSATRLSDIHVFELYSPCTITELLVSEAIGIYPRGEAGVAAASGDTSISGTRPINTSGGCLSRGHPPPLTGLYGVLEIYEQLLGKAADRQVPQSVLGMCSSELGNYNAALVHILERAR